MSKVKLITYAPVDDGDAIRDAFGSVGAGKIGEYTYCSFTTRGLGRSKPSERANPYYGTIGTVNVEDEERIEVVCERSDAKKAIDAMKKVHPYEEVAIEIIPLLSEDEL
jgi:hypothetical protein